MAAGLDLHSVGTAGFEFKSPQPDDRHFVLPRRAHAETVRAYIVRIDEAVGGDFTITARAHFARMHTTEQVGACTYGYEIGARAAVVMAP